MQVTLFHHKRNLKYTELQKSHTTDLTQCYTRNTATKQIFKSFQRIRAHRKTSKIMTEFCFVVSITSQIQCTLINGKQDEQFESMT